MSVIRNPISQEVKDIARKIGEVFLEINENDYEKTAETIRNLGVESIIITPENEVQITLSRVGLFIGKRGQTIDKVCNALGRKVKVVETTESITDYMTPVKDEYEYVTQLQDQAYQEMKLDHFEQTYSGDDHND